MTFFITDSTILSCTVTKIFLLAFRLLLFFRYLINCLIVCEQCMKAECVKMETFAKYKLFI